MRLRVVDFETTGIAPPAAVIEVGTCDVVDNGGGWRVEQPTGRLHGGGKITAETRAVHHISPLEIEGLPPFEVDEFHARAQADEVGALAAHHANFEAQWLGGGRMICTYKSALRVWPNAPSHQNQVLRYWLEEQGLTAPEAMLCQPAHRAAPDAYATAHLLHALLQRATVTELLAWSSEPAALPRCPIGKYRNARWSEIDDSYLRWMVSTKDMDADLRWNAQRELDQRRQP